MQEARGKAQVANLAAHFAFRGIALMLAAVLASAVAAGVAAAQGGPVTDDQVNAVAKQLNCPVCENVPLDVCETQACVQWRDLIRKKLAAGETPAQIIAYFRATYGDRVLQSPPREGFTGLVWILPFAGLIAGVAILVVVLRRMAVQPKAEVKIEAEPSLAAYRERLERELKESGQ
jgi:cytochrome c-type biogenesis protein CcmH